MAGKKHSFNGREVAQGATMTPLVYNPVRNIYTLVGSKPTVRVEECEYRGKKTFLVTASIGRVTLTKGRGGRRIRRRRSIVRFEVSETTLPKALRKLESNMALTFKELAKVLGYELEG